MNDLVIKRDLRFPNLVIIACITGSGFFFYQLPGSMFILPLIVAGFFFWVSRTATPPEYFWANQDGIEFHISKHELTKVSWDDIEAITLTEDVDSNLAAIEIKLMVKLDNPPIYIRSSGILTTKLNLVLANKSREKFEHLKVLQERNSI